MTFFWVKIWINNRFKQPCVHTFVKNGKKRIGEKNPEKKLTNKQTWKRQKQGKNPFLLSLGLPALNQGYFSISLVCQHSSLA